MRTNDRTEVYLVDIVDYTVDDLSLERLENDCSLSRNKFCLATSREDHPLPDVEDRHNSDNITKLARASSFNI